MGDNQVGCCVELEHSVRTPPPRERRQQNVTESVYTLLLSAM